MDKTHLTAIWTYSDKNPEIIADALNESGITTTLETGSSENAYYTFQLKAPSKMLMGSSIEGNIKGPQPVDQPIYEYFFKHKTFRLDKFASKIRIYGEIANNPNAAFKTLPPVFQALKESEINFVATAVGMPLIQDLIGYHINGETLRDTEDRHGLARIIQ